MSNQTQAANINTEETLEDVIADYRLGDVEREALQKAAEEITSNMQSKQIADFLQNLRREIERIRRPIVDSHVKDIAAATKALARKATQRGKGRIDYFSYEVPEGAVYSLIERLNTLATDSLAD